MPKNLIDAIIEIIQARQFTLPRVMNRDGRNQIADEDEDQGKQGQGLALELYVKRAFAGALSLDNEDEIQERLSETFSFQGAKNHPPDAKIRGGECLEIKKIGKAFSELQFNSSPPAATLSSSDARLILDCQNSEGRPWEEKVLYVVGVVPPKTRKISQVFFVYGEDYCPYIHCNKIYFSLKKKIGKIKSVSEDTNELGAVKAIGPKGYTSLRIRGMWKMKSPWKVFAQSGDDQSGRFTLLAVISDTIWNNLSNRDVLQELASRNSLTIEDFPFYNPNNAKRRRGKLIKFVCDLPQDSPEQN